jgi:tetratricopeptide (TPR) repeat protein
MKMKRFVVLISILITSFLVAEAQLNINHYIRVGRTRISIGNFTGAIEYFNIVIKFRPYLPEAYFYRGVAKHELEDFRGAIIDYNKAIEIKPFYPHAYMNRGMAYHNLELYDKAIEDYNKGLEFDSDNEGIYNNRGIARLAKRDVDGAIEDYNKALEINPKSTNALMNRSNARIVQGKIEEAIRDLNQVIIIRPHFASAYLNRGLARFEMDDYASALRDYDQCIKLDPENALAFNNRGIVKHRLEDYEGAIMDYDMAIKLNPEMASAWFNRAMAREILGRDGYESDYRIAAQLNPQFDLSSRRLDAEQLAQKQSQQGTGSSAGQGQGTSQQNVARQDTTNQNATAKNIAKQDSITPDNQESERRRSRSRINLVVEDTRDLPSEEEEVDDGRVQNRNITIDLQPIFVVSAFEKNSVDYDRFQYYNLSIDEVNAKNNYNPLLTITNKPVDNYSEVFENFVLYFNARLEINESSHNYLNRAIFYSLTDRYPEAMEDVERSISMNNKEALAYFVRANIRYKMLEQIEMLENPFEETTISVGTPQQSEQNNETFAMPEYQKILDDYQTLLYQKPDFFFGYYNRAYIKLRLREYKSAIEDLNKAIELEPEFAEGYFNRGLTKIFLDDIEGGALDLSRAGELGIYGAYNIIKRYCN